MHAAAVAVDRRSRVRRRIFGPLLALSMIAAACGSEDSVAPSDVGPPVTGSSTSSEPDDATPATALDATDLDRVPLLDGSEQIGPVSSMGDGVLTATFEIDAASAQQIIESMADLLVADEWEALVPPTERPPGAFRTEWARDGRRLEVVADDAPALDGADRQYSVLLHPDLDDEDVDAGRPATAP